MRVFVLFVVFVCVFGLALEGRRMCRMLFGLGLRSIDSDLCQNAGFESSFLLLEAIELQCWL